jgi:hypothetical protein
MLCCSPALRAVLMCRISMSPRLLHSSKPVLPCSSCCCTLPGNATPQCCQPPATLLASAAAADSLPLHALLRKHGCLGDGPSGHGQVDCLWSECGRWGVHKEGSHVDLLLHEHVCSLLLCVYSSSCIVVMAMVRSGLHCLRYCRCACCSMQHGWGPSHS